MNSPLVSICMPVYNCERTIKDAVDSALNQSYNNTEIIIVENCSSDKTYELLKTYNNPKIKLFRNDKVLTMAENWNKCLSLISGDYIHYLHGDDILTPKCIERKMHIINANNDLVLVFSATEIIDSNNNTLMIRRYKNKDLLLDGKKFALKSFLYRNLYGEPSNVLIKTSAINENGGFCTRLRFTVDWDLWLRLSTIGDIYYINEQLTKYRVSVNNTTSSLKIKDMLDDDLKMIENLKLFNGLKFGRIRIIIHRINFFIRDLFRMIYMKYLYLKISKSGV